MRLYMLVGNIATGKSTIAKKLAEDKDTVIVSLDSLRYMIKGEYVFDVAYEGALREVEDNIINELMWHQFDIVVDDAKLVCPLQRAELLNLAHEKEYDVIAVKMPTMPRDICVKRRMENPHGQYCQEKWEEVWDMFNSRYVAPTKLEGFDAILTSEDIRTGFLGNI